MSFSDITQNLAIGIAGGIFSSIIVSVVFYILTEFKDELRQAIDMTLPLYRIAVANKTKEIRGKIAYKALVIDSFEKMEENFENFQPWRFRYELKTTLVNINGILQNEYMNITKWNEEEVSDVCKDLEICLNELEHYEKNFYKFFIKRVFNNGIILYSIVIFMCLIIIA